MSELKRSEQEETAKAAMAMLEQAEAVFFDLDGCIYFGDRLAPGAKEVLDRLRDRKDKHVRFVTNNSTDTGSQVALRLSAMGLVVDPDHVLTATELIGQYLLERHGALALKAVGSDSLLSALAWCGHRLVPLDSEDSAKAVVIGRDPKFDYAKLQAVVEEMDRGTPVYATNPDLFHPGSRGEKVPETGALYKPAEAITGRVVEYFGKPAPHMFHLAIRHCGVTRPDACVMVGDNPHTDIAGGRAAGIRTLWLCGEAMDSPGIPAGGLADFAVANLFALVNL